MNKKIILIINILIFPVIGGLAGYLSAAGLNDWYTALNKPFFNPPAYIFGPVWTVLYILMGLSFYQIITSENPTHKSKAITFFLIQLLFNYSWSFVFFSYHKVVLAAIVLLLIICTSLATCIYFYKIKKTAAYLLFPYICWLSFAFILNIALVVLN